VQRSTVGETVKICDAYGSSLARPPTSLEREARRFSLCLHAGAVWPTDSTVPGVTDGASAHFLNKLVGAPRTRYYDYDDRICG